jgi:integrase
MKGRIPSAVVAQMLARWKRFYAPWSMFTYAASLKKLLRHIDGQLQTNLAEGVSKIVRPPPRRVLIEQEELDRLLAAAPPHLKLFISLMVGMGLRFAEAQRAAPEHFDRESQTLTLKTKGGKIRQFPVPDAIAALFAIAPENGQGTYIERLRGRGPMHRGTLRQQWNALKRKAGVRMEVNPHDLRRTAAVRVYQLTKDVMAVQALLGHDSLMSTAHYLSAHEPKAMRTLETELRRWTPKGAVQ